MIRYEDLKRWYTQTPQKFFWEAYKTYNELAPDSFKTTPATRGIAKGEMTCWIETQLWKKLTDKPRRQNE